MILPKVLVSSVKNKVQEIQNWTSVVTYLEVNRNNFFEDPILKEIVFLNTIHTFYCLHIVGVLRDEKKRSIDIKEVR